MKIKFLGAARTVTGSCHLIKTEKTRFLVDCGLFQGGSATKEYNYKDFKIAPNLIDFVILTHAHIDHSGLLPKLVKHGFKGEIFCTHVTGELLQVMLPDSANIQESEVERKNRKNKRSGEPLIDPIYNGEDAQKTLQYIHPLNYDETYKLAPDVEVRLRDAGHILGSAILEIWTEEKNGQKIKTVFSGDLGQRNQPIIKDPTIIESADYVVLESTYGDRFHRQGLERREEFKNIIKETMRKGGNLVIPAFAVERTQDLLFDLYYLFSNNEIDPSISVYIDSPLAVAATEIFQKRVEYYDYESRNILEQGDHPLKFDNLKFSRTQEESMALNNMKGNAIIISASGMCDAGRIRHHLKHNLWRDESTVLFVGYQAQGSLGRRILEGEDVVRIHGEDIAVRADIRTIEAYSAHADQGELINWLSNFRPQPKKVILVHGDPEPQDILKKLIIDKFDIPVFIPEWLDEIELHPVSEVDETKEVEAITDEISAPITSLNQALQAEELYLELRMKLNQIFTEGNKQQDYEKMLEKLQAIKKLLN